MNGACSACFRWSTRGSHHDEAARDSRWETVTVAKYKTCPHCGSRYPVRTPRRARPRPEDDMGVEAFRALSWIWFWDAAGRPGWAARRWGLVPGDGLVPDDLPI